MIYLLCFGVSAGFACLANRTKNRPLFLLLSFLSILVPVVLAGLRDYSVGIDTGNYLKQNLYWKGAVSAPSVWAYLQNTEFKEPLFGLFLGGIAKLTGEYRVFLFLTHLVIVSCMYIGAFRMKEYAEPALVLLLFYLLFFSPTLNVMRQYMAMAILFAAFADILQQKYLRYYSFALAAVLIHTTAIIAFGLPVLFLFLHKGRESRLSPATVQRCVFVCLILSVLVAVFVPVARILIENGVLPSRYLTYLKGDSATANVIPMYFLAFELAAVFFLGRSMKEACSRSDFLIMCTLVYLILLQLSWMVNYGKRLALYFAFANLFTLGVLARGQKNRVNRVLVGSCTVAMALLYWWFLYVYHNFNQTYPYALGAF